MINSKWHRKYSCACLEECQVSPSQWCDFKPKFSVNLMLGYFCALVKTLYMHWHFLTTLSNKNSPWISKCTIEHTNQLQIIFHHDYYRVANIQGDVYWYLEILRIPLRLIITPPHLLIFNKKIWSELFLPLTCFIFNILQAKHLFHTYLMQFWLILFIYWH